MASAQRKNEVLPNPDPSFITTEQIDKAVGQLEKRIDARFDGIEKATASFHADLTRVPTLLDRSILGLRELIDQRILCMENDVKSVHDFLDDRGKAIAEQVTHLRELTFSKIEKVSDLTGERIAGSTALTNEKIKSLSDVTTQQFKSIVDTFAEKDKAVSVGLSTQSASAAAQQASNAASTNKMEDNFTKLLDQGRDLLTEIRRNTDLQLNEIKSRLDRGEGGSKAVDRSVDRTSTVITLVIAGLVALVVVVGAIATVVMATRAPAVPIYLPAPANSATR